VSGLAAIGNGRHAVAGSDVPFPTEGFKGRLRPCRGPGRTCCVPRYSPTWSARRSSRASSATSDGHGSSPASDA